MNSEGYNGLPELRSVLIHLLPRGPTDNSGVICLLYKALQISCPSSYPTVALS